MHRFFEPALRPLLDAARPSAVIEVGSGTGQLTELLAAWCEANDAVLHAIDPLPKYDIAEWQSRWPGRLKIYRDLSLNAFSDIGPVDFVIIDGDHNWYTVFNELQLLNKAARAAQRTFPLTVVHDVGFPYGRRDRYLDPTTIPEAFRQPHRRGGIKVGQRALADEGLNDQFENAIHEGTPRNGVLTAVEDFANQLSGELEFHVIPGLHGLAVVVDHEAPDTVADALRSMLATSGLSRVVEAVEVDRLSRLELVRNTRVDLLREQANARRLKQSIEETRQRLGEKEGALDEALHALRASEDRAEEVEERAMRAEERAERAEGRADRAETWYRESVVEHDEKVRALEARLKALQRTFSNETSLRSKREQDLARLRSRRSVRIALAMARLARPVLRSRNRKRASAPNETASSSITAPSPDDSKASGSSPIPTSTRVELPEAEDETGVFFTLMRDVLLHRVPPAFADAWGSSEAESPQTDQGPSDGPLVSIIMPTYNRAHLIDQAIRSVLDQTYHKWELVVCDDGSDDGTDAVVTAFADERINYHRLTRGGAASARNFGLAQAEGEVLAYLDSDNIWHPRFLAALVSALVVGPGRYTAYCKFIDVVVDSNRLRLKSFDSRPFSYETLSTRNFIDLNGFVHRRSLYDRLGGFDERLVRQMDWELILRYTYLRDPVYVDQFLLMYRRNERWNQITRLHREDKSSPALVRSAVDASYRNGLPTTRQGPSPSLTVLSWDICRNHFSKAYNVAEAMASETQVQLVGFRFFEDPIFPPYANTEPDFATLFLPGGEFPGWNQHLARAVANLSGDIIYAVKPRLPSLGAALLANYQFGTPIVVEINDLESVVNTPWRGDQLSTIQLSDVNLSDPELRKPHSDLWAQIMEGLVKEIPLRVTHNSELDRHFGEGAFFVRNPKNEEHYDPDRLDRHEIRSRLGFSREDRVILFGGMIRRHKGVFQLLDLLQEKGSRYRLVVVASRPTPDLNEFRAQADDRVRILDAVDRNQMAEINLASDAVVLWLDPDVRASRYQMPFKLTDALAMRVPVVANDIGDLGELARQGYLRQVPFGRTDVLRATLDGLFEDREATLDMVEAGRRLYLRQFSYNAVRRNLEIIMAEAIASSGTLPVAKEFAEFFSSFQDHIRAEAGTDHAETVAPGS